MTLTPFTALSPVDGRYSAGLDELRSLFSEAGLMRLRVRVEVAWLRHLMATLPDVQNCSAADAAWLDGLVAGFGVADAETIKEIESTTQHDVKAVEYFLRKRLMKRPSLAGSTHLLHFACTSEDINNLAYALAISEARSAALVPALAAVTDALGEIATQHAGTPMLARTHGQAASPTTLGKELVNVLARLARLREQLERVEILGKMNGAVGNYNAHVAAYPDIDWPAEACRFVEQLGLTFNPYTTQIEPHDFMAEYFNVMARINTILIDLCRDLWGYVSIGYFMQKARAGEVGSSTMPHKINPIHFENAEGNLGVANALLNHLAAKLPISRWQRDLSDSTVLRNIGVALAHSQIACASLAKGLGRLAVDEDAIRADLDANVDVLGEAVQTVMRRYGAEDAYEQLRAFTRGRKVSAADLGKFIAGLDLPDAARDALAAITPATYIGHAEALAKAFTRPRK